MAREVYCNLCGKPFNVWDIQAKLSITANLSYGSDYDGETIEIDFCQTCVDEIIRKCRINPIVKLA